LLRPVVFAHLEVCGAQPAHDCAGRIADHDVDDHQVDVGSKGRPWRLLRARGRTCDDEREG
jgi:hypothetical protein